MFQVSPEEFLESAPPRSEQNLPSTNSAELSPTVLVVSVAEPFHLIAEADEETVGSSAGVVAAFAGTDCRSCATTAVVTAIAVHLPKLPNLSTVLPSRNHLGGLQGLLVSFVGVETSFVSLLPHAFLIGKHSKTALHYSTVLLGSKDSQIQSFLITFWASEKQEKPACLLACVRFGASRKTTIPVTKVWHQIPPIC